MEDFYQHIYQKQQAVQDMPSNKAIAQWAVGLMHLLFPERNSKTFHTVQEIEDAFKQSEADLYLMLFKTKACSSCNIKKISEQFFTNLPSIYERMLTDAKAIMDGDPAAQSLNEVIRTYPGFLAISIYRLANELWTQGIPLIPRILTEYAHSKTGIDIHPGALLMSTFISIMVLVL
ncbi:serine O-acetyltransferase [Sphingobacterium daejeonense]|uniref:serine O-acetyltransferase n=1 Tax=Sphingobacterium daejeonense TaxID=371142 RepID=UPI0010C4DE29|nr:hypothetical protein [Sphingobacterium daejeonense]VTQ04148.1 Serine acetyltransferase [Sphingobacterium daejeonense]